MQSGLAAALLVLLCCCAALCSCLVWMVATGARVMNRVSTTLASMSKPLAVSSMTGRNASLAPDGSLRVTYPAGAFASAGGVNEKVAIGPTTTAFLSYEVLFETGWCWGGSKHGVKLPGLWFGSASAKCGTGGDWGGDCGSLRVMVGAGGAPYAYIYYAKTGSPDDMSDQPAAYAQAAKDSGRTGHNMFKQQLGSLRADGATWNKVTVGVGLNGVGSSDGSLTVSVNGTSKTFKGMRWRRAADQLIRQVLVHSWHGGSSSAWACPKPTYARFRNFQLISLQ